MNYPIVYAGYAPFLIGKLSKIPPPRAKSAIVHIYSFSQLTIMFHTE